MTGKVRSAVKLAVIAREAGVSVSTVSKVVNGRADVSAGTRARVRGVLDRYGYPLDSSPVASAKLGSALLDVIIRELESAWSSALLSEVERAAADRGLNIVVSTVQADPVHPIPPRRWLDQVSARGTCGVLGILVDFSEAQSDYLRDAAIPRVVVDPSAEQERSVTTVRIDNRRSQYRLTRHLIELGHTQIAMVDGNRHTLPARERREGFEAAMREARLPIREAWRKDGGFDRDDAQRAMTELMTGPERPTAVAFASDKGALGGLAAARLLGLDVPGEVSVTGFDDIPDARAAIPALTTVRQPVEAMVAAALDRIVDPPQVGRRIMCAAEPVFRDSTAPPRR